MHWLVCCHLCPLNLSLLLPALKVSQLAVSLWHLVLGSSSPALCSCKPCFPKACWAAGCWQYVCAAPAFPGSSSAFQLLGLNPSFTWPLLGAGTGVPGNHPWQMIAQCRDACSGKNFAQGLFPIQLSYWLEAEAACGKPAAHKQQLLTRFAVQSAEDNWFD